MSGIYICGMEMPKEGNETILRLMPDGTVLDQYGHHLALKAVPVPPHGRLGDLDTLAGYIHQQEDWLSEAAIHAFCGILCKMPTIIPAEEGEV